MTNYQRWQLENYGNCLSETKSILDPEEQEEKTQLEESLDVFVEYADFFETDNTE